MSENPEDVKGQATRRWQSPEAVALLLDVDASRIVGLIRSGALRAVDVGGVLRIPPEALADYLEPLSPTKRLPRRGARARLLPNLAAVALALVVGVLGASLLRAQGMSSSASFAVPYHGYLEESGAPVEGARHVTFRLYLAEQGGNAVWSESHVVDVSAGRFVTNLGMVNPLDDVMRQGGSLYVGISVDGVDGGAPLGAPVDLIGRQLLGSAPFARRAAPGKDFAVDGKLALGTWELGDTAGALALRTDGGLSVKMEPSGDVRIGENASAKRNLTVEGSVVVGDGVDAADVTARGAVTGANGRADCGLPRLDLSAGSCNTLWPNQTACQARLCNDCGCSGFAARRVVVEGN